MTEDLPGFSFIHSAWPTVFMVVAFGLSVGAALVGIVGGWLRARYLAWRARADLGWVPREFL